MTPLKIGACLAPLEIQDDRDWLFEANRDIELQGFSTHNGTVRQNELEPCRVVS